MIESAGQKLLAKNFLYAAELLCHFRRIPCRKKRAFLVLPTPTLAARGLPTYSSCQGWAMAYDLDMVCAHDEMLPCKRNQERLTAAELHNVVEFSNSFSEYVLLSIPTLTPLTSSKIRPSSVKSTINSCISISISPLPADAPSSYAAMRGAGVRAARVPKQPARTMLAVVLIEVELGPTSDDSGKGAWTVGTNASAAYAAKTAKQRTWKSGEKIILRRNNTQRCLARLGACVFASSVGVKNIRLYTIVGGLQKPGLRQVRRPRRSPQT